MSHASRSPRSSRWPLRSTGSVSLAALLAAVTLVDDALATEWYRAPVREPLGGPATAVGARLREVAELRLADVDLALRGELPTRSFRTLRLDQQYESLPVLGRSAAVRLASGGRVRVVALDVERSLAVDPVPRIDADRARAVVGARFGGDASRARASLAVLPARNGDARLVWAIDRPTSKGGYRALVDAHDGLLVGRHPLGRHVLGRVYEESAVVTPEPIDVELTDLVVSSPQYLNGWSGQLAVTNYVSGSSMSTEPNYVVEQTVEPNAGEDFLYDPPADATDATDAFAQVNLYYHLTRMRDYFAGTHGIDFSPARWKLVAMANLQENGEPYDNAFYTSLGAQAPFDAPNMIAVGQGTEFDFSDDSDVFLHEFTHYVSANAVGYSGGMFVADEWGLNTMAGGIEEGIADYMACTVNDDPELGEASLALLGSSRDLTVGGKVCPDDVYGESHMDGEIIGNLTWTLREQLGTEIADDLVWGAVTLLTPGVTLGDFGTALLQTADDFIDEGTLGADDRAMIETELAARGLDDCGHEIAIAPGEPRHTVMFGLDILGEYMGMSCAEVADFMELHSLFHFWTTPTADDTGLRIQVELEELMSGSLDWAIYARRGEHVGFDVMYGMIPVVEDYDYVSARFDGLDGELVIDESSTPPFDPQASYHFVIVHANCGTVAATVSVAAPGQGGAGGGGVGGGVPVGGEGGAEPGATPVSIAPAGGCLCRVGGAELGGSGERGLGGHALWLGALVPLALGMRRRRAGR